MDKKYYELNFNFTNEDLDKLFDYVSDYYTKNTKSTRNSKFLKYSFLFLFVLGVIISLFNLFTGTFNALSSVIFILTIMSCVVFTQVSITPKGFKSSFLKYIGTKPLRVSIDDSTISRKILFTGKPFEVNLSFKNLSTILFYDDIIILIFKSFCFPIKLSEKDTDYDQIMDFLKSKLPLEVSSDLL
ncbi:MAG: hypothetical protein ACRDAU_06890 [Clostridium sp.]